MRRSPPRRESPGSLIRELSAFGIVGAACFLVDLAVFQVLYAHVGLEAVLSKLAASCVSTTAAFAGHRLWSFSARAHTGVRREYPLFVAVNGATLLLSLGIVALVRYPLEQEGALVLQAANILAIAVGTAVRFTAYRRWVFPSVALASAPAGRGPATPAGMTAGDARGEAGTPDVHERRGS